MASMQQMQSTFNLRMEPIQTHDEYPKYARSETKPVVRARNIIDQGAISAHPCSVCVELGQDCYRWEGNFSKCAYCTSKDRKRELCHVPGQEAPPAPERRKRRRITGNIHAPGGYAASAADTIWSGLPSGPTPCPRIPTPGASATAPRPDPASTMMGVFNTQAVPLAITLAGSEVTLEHTAALEKQVSYLKEKVLELRATIEELSSGVSTSSTPRSQAAAGASPTSSIITFVDLQAQRLADAPPPSVDVASAVHLSTE